MPTLINLNGTTPAAPGGGQNVLFQNDSSTPINVSAYIDFGNLAVPINFKGSSSGAAALGVAAIAGTPNKILLPTTTGTAGQVLSTDGANPQQTSWATAMGGSLASTQIAFGSASNTVAGSSDFTWTQANKQLNVILKDNNNGVTIDASAQVSGASRALYINCVPGPLGIVHFELVGGGGGSVDFQMAGSSSFSINCANGVGIFNIDKENISYLTVSATPGTFRIHGTSGGDFQLSIATGMITVYGSISTVGNGVPVLVAKSSLTAQSSAIGATTIYAVPATGAGLYRVSYRASVTTAGSVSSTLGGTTGFQGRYTDLNDSVVKTSNPTTPIVSSGNTTTTTISGSVYANCKASTNLQYLFDYTSSGTAMAYDLDVYVEYLG